MPKGVNYRKIYKDHYNIDFNSEYVIHHIDFDRNNNDISNLLLLPKELHRRYHELLQALDWLHWDTGVITLKSKINQFRLLPYASTNALIEFVYVYVECMGWYNEKMMMDSRLSFGLTAGGNFNGA